MQTYPVDPADSPGGCDSYEPRHDFCSDSPDWFYAGVSRQADFQGPCANHDMCYDRNWNLWPNYLKSPAKYECDARLPIDMKQNCNFEYPGLLWLADRHLCNDTANVYYAAVFVKGGHGQDPLPPSPPR